MNKEKQVNVNLGILIWPNSEVLDFCGPYETFRNAGKMGTGLNAFIVSKEEKELSCLGMRITPNYSFESCPPLDILLIPGGNTPLVLEDEEYLNWVGKQFSDLKSLITVCTGALIAAKIGLIGKGLEATTHQNSMELLKELAPEAKVLADVRFTDNGKIIMSGGISAGIDSALYLVKKLFGEETANKVSVRMEYDWQIKEPNTVARY